MGKCRTLLHIQKKYVNYFKDNNGVLLRMFYLYNKFPSVIILKKYNLKIQFNTEKFNQLEARI